MAVSWLRLLAVTLLVLTGSHLTSEPTTAAKQVASSRQIGNPHARFSVSLVPDVPVPIRVGTNLALRLSSGTAGYANLYLIDPVGEVWVLAENLSTAAGSFTYPSLEQSFTLVADEPLGLNRVILLVTRQPFAGFGGNATLTRPVSLAVRGDSFLQQLNRATARLPPASWAADDLRVRVVA